MNKFKVGDRVYGRTNHGVSAINIIEIERDPDRYIIRVEGGLLSYRVDGTKLFPTRQQAESYFNKNSDKGRGRDE